MTTGSLHTDHALLQQLSTGSEKAFTTIYNQYKDAIYYAAYKMTNSSIVAEEVVQDVFLKLWIKREKAVTIENIKAYLHTMAENLVYDAVKRQHKEQAHFPDIQVEETISATPAILLEHKDYQLILQNAIDRLPLKQKETYRLIKEQGLKRDEAAQRLSVSPETIKWNLDQAMRSIRAYCLLRLGVSIGVLMLLKLL